MKKFLVLFLLAVLIFNQGAIAVSLCDSIIMETEYDKSIRSINYAITEVEMPTTFLIKEQFKKDIIMANIMIEVLEPLISNQETLFKNLESEKMRTKKEDRRNFTFNFGDFYDNYIAPPFTYIFGVPVLCVLFLLITPFALGAALWDL